MFLSALWPNKKYLFFISDYFCLKEAIPSHIQILLAKIILNRQLEYSQGEIRGQSSQA